MQAASDASSSSPASAANETDAGAASFAGIRPSIRTRGHAHERNAAPRSSTPSTTTGTSHGPGSGGRVKVELTGAGADFTDFAGTIEANGGGMQNNNDASAYDVSPAAAGTVCLMAPGADPLVKVDNVFRYNGGEPTWRVPAGESVAPATHLPAMQDGDTRNALQKTNWELSGHGALRLTRDARVQSLSLVADDGSQCVYTEGHTLTVKEMTVAGKSVHTGVHTAADMPSIVIGTGSVVIDFMPTLLLVR